VTSFDEIVTAAVGDASDQYSDYSFDKIVTSTVGDASDW
jgi:hypothetical protein